jgi:hypothetical protein
MWIHAYLMLQILIHQFRLKRTNAYNTNNNNKGNNNKKCRNLLSSDDWQRISEDIRKKLYSNQK